MKIIYGSLILSCCLILTAFCEDETVKHGNPKQAGHYKEGEHDDQYDHEAILGSDDEIDEYAQLSPEETKDRLTKLFPLMDENADGKVDETELTHWVMKSFLKLNTAETKMRMESDDADEDGFVSWAEYLDSTYGMTEEELEKYKSEDLKDKESKDTMEQSLGYDKKKFNAADENSDGKLSTDEAVAFLHPYDFERMSDVETDRVMGEFDTNNDGKIDMEEYLGHSAFSKNAEGGDRFDEDEDEVQTAEDIEGEKENFKYNDEDKDGSLNRAEVYKWVTPDMTGVAGEEAAHLIQETDENSDGGVTLDEIIKQSDLWVGSEASDLVMSELDHDEL